MVTRAHLLLLAAVALLGALAPGEAAAGEACRPVVRVSGKPDVVAPVIALLRARRLTPGSASRCGVVDATLAAGDGEQLRMTITDPDGRTVERVAEDAEGAATAIESWARGDVVDPLLSARMAAPEELEAAAPPALDRTEPPTGPAAAAPAWRSQLGAAVESGLSGDGALWAGVRVQACVRIRWLCAGALARYAVDTERSGDTETLTSVRSGVDALAIAEIPLRRGRLALSPGVGLGQSSLHAARNVPGHEDREDVVAWRLRGHVAAEVAFARVWSIRLDLAAEYGPDANVRLGDEIDGNADPGADAPLAGSPRWLGWLGLGITYGGL